MSDRGAIDGLATPVAFFIFNRPETTARVFAEIARARPTTLLVVADGPRLGRGEDAVCQQTRDIIRQVNWPCQVFTNFADTNLGCRMRISSGLSWVFEQVESAIVLEDDCLPHLTFFPFCEQLLASHREHPEVMHIGGSNYTPDTSTDAPTVETSYRYSKYANIWGWATWRRAWQKYDIAMTPWATHAFWDRHFRDSSAVEKRYWRALWQAVDTGRYDTWDVQWVLSCIACGGLCIVPNVNLVSNIGFGSKSTHTQHVGLADLPTHAMRFPLRSPQRIERDEPADRAAIGHLARIGLPPLWRRLWRRIARTAGRAGIRVA